MRFIFSTNTPIIFYTQRIGFNIFRVPFKFYNWKLEDGLWKDKCIDMKRKINVILILY